MYGLNTFLRFVRFVSNSFIGLVVGFVAGYIAANIGIAETITRFEQIFK